MGSAIVVGKAFKHWLLFDYTVGILVRYGWNLLVLSFQALLFENLIGFLSVFPALGAAEPQPRIGFSAKAV